MLDAIKKFLKELTITTTLAISAFVLFIIFAVTILIIYTSKDPAAISPTTRAQERAEILRKIRESEEIELQQAGWIDQAKGTYRIPIKRAMELTVTELKSKKVVATSKSAAPIPSVIVPPAANP